RRRPRWEGPSPIRRDAAAIGGPRSRPSRVPAPPGVVRVDNLSPMILTSDPGPVGAPTSKDAAGFLAPSAVRFTGAAGERTEAPLPAPEGGRTPIGRQIASGDVLRWFVHPQLDAQQSWGATWVAIDLLLDDGSRLSDHAPREHYATLANARGNGEARTLHPRQWNDVQIALAAVVGRTVTEVLLVLDAPADPDADLLDEVEAPRRTPPSSPAGSTAPTSRRVPRTRRCRTRWPGSTPGAAPTPPPTSPAATRCP